MSRRKDVMLCYPFEEKRLYKWGFPVLVQPKLDGVRCRTHIMGFGISVVSSEGRHFMDMPAVEGARALTTISGFPVDGELCSDELTFEEIVSITSRTVNRHEHENKVYFNAFDIINTEPQAFRLLRLSKYTGIQDDYNVRIVPTRKAYSLEEVLFSMEQFVDEGYEGIIVRQPSGLYKPRRSTNIMKFKPHKTGLFSITGMNEEVSKEGCLKGTLGALVCKTDDGKQFNVGSGFTRGERKDIWNKLTDFDNYLVEVKYQHTTLGGVPRFPVFSKLIIKDR